MPPTGRGKGRRAPIDLRKKRVDCIFCKPGHVIDYKDMTLLRKFVSERGKIRVNRVTRLCNVHQRRVSVAVKNAREMALLPYVQTRRS